MRRENWSGEHTSWKYRAVVLPLLPLLMCLLVLETILFGNKAASLRLYNHHDSASWVIYKVTGRDMSWDNHWSDV